MCNAVWISPASQADTGGGQKSRVRPKARSPLVPGESFQGPSLEGPEPLISRGLSGEGRHLPASTITQTPLFLRRGSHRSLHRPHQLRSAARLPSVMPKPRQDQSCVTVLFSMLRSPSLQPSSHPSPYQHHQDIVHPPNRFLYPPGFTKHYYITPLQSQSHRRCCNTLRVTCSKGLASTAQRGCLQDTKVCS